MPKIKVSRKSCLENSYDQLRRDATSLMTDHLLVCDKICLGLICVYLGFHSFKPALALCKSEKLKSLHSKECWTLYIFSGIVMHAINFWKIGSSITPETCQIFNQAQSPTVRHSKNCLTRNSDECITKESRKLHYIGSIAIGFCYLLTLESASLKFHNSDLLPKYKLSVLMNFCERMITDSSLIGFH